MLGHTEEGDLSDTERTPQDIREMEAEAVSLLCCESLGLPGAEYSRGYVQSWGQGQTFTERSAQRIFHAALQAPSSQTVNGSAWPVWRSVLAFVDPQKILGKRRAHVCRPAKNSWQSSCLSARQQFP
jgi:hypothetical protein